MAQRVLSIFASSASDARLKMQMSAKHLGMYGRIRSVKRDPQHPNRYLVTVVTK